VEAVHGSAAGCWLKRLQAETSAELDALLPSILDRAFKGGALGGGSFWIFDFGFWIKDRAGPPSRLFAAINRLFALNNCLGESLIAHR
jgi:hypothetical protein